MNATRCNHETWINSTANNTTKWIPGSFVKPIQKLIKSTFDHICGCTIIEPKNQMILKMTKTKIYRWVYGHVNACIFLSQRNEWKERVLLLLPFFHTYQGSNSWMILSNRMTANNRDANPDIHASIRTANVIKLLQPAALRLITMFFEFAMVHKQVISNLNRRKNTTKHHTNKSHTQFNYTWLFVWNLEKFDGSIYFNLSKFTIKYDIISHLIEFFLKFKHEFGMIQIFCSFLFCAYL